MRRPVFLSGKVQMADGSPLPEPVMIERVCNGIARAEGYTDTKGRFSFELGRNSMMLADASQSSGLDPFGGFGNNSSMPGLGPNNQGIRERDLFGCELRANLPGFRSEVIPLATRRFLDNPDVGIILLQRMGNVEGLTISATTANAPKDAQKLFDKGRKALDKGKADEAAAHLAKAVEIYPKYAVAWNELGRAQEKLQNQAEARKAYEAALAADAKLVQPYEGLYMLAARENRWEDVARLTDTIIKLNPFDFPHAYYFNSLAYLNLQDYAAAEKSCREFLKMDKQHRIPKAAYVLGVILANKSEFTEATQVLKSYLETATNPRDIEAARNTLAQVEKIAKSPQQ
jgi:tetratricopeptide (TPR) repeat protein